MISITFNYYSISLLLGGFTALLSGFIVFLNDRKKLENQAWFALTLSTAVWSFSYFSLSVAPDINIARISDILLHYAAILIPLFYFLLVLIVTNTYRKNKISWYVSVLFAFFFIIIVPNQLFIGQEIPKVGFNFAPVPGPLYIFFFLYFCVLVLYGIVILALASQRSKVPADRIRFSYIVLFTLAASVGGGNVFVTTYFPGIPPYFLILFSIYPAISGYAILRHQLFDTKVIATQTITFGLWIFIFVRILLSESPYEQIVNFILLLITIVFGIFLIRSVKREVKSREKIEALAKDLENANEKLKELDQQKSEFVSLASHQLRGPLTAIKGYASMILEGDFGSLTEGLKDPINRIFKSTEAMVVLVGDYLDVSRIEQGRMKYDMTDFDEKELVEAIMGELTPTINSTKLNVTFQTDNKSNYTVHGDQGKIKQVISNLIDNALKYTLQGFVHVAITKNDVTRKILVSIEDSGVGIRPEVLPRLFEKFTRAPDASKTNIMGTGLGLYVAKKMIEAHNGRIWAESPGAGKGSIFYIELSAL